MITDGIGLYVHIPFCAAKCNYCDFNSAACISKLERQGYIKALIGEIYSYRETPKIPVETIFFGGGTPSYLEADEFLLIYQAIAESFDLSHLSEFTVESNPKTLTEEKLKAYTSVGVNRVSIGLQTIHENERKILGRIHDSNDFLEAVELVKKYGITNINADVMYGIPEQTERSFEETLKFVTSLNIPHISVYGLIIEENTPFGKMQNELSLPTEDDETRMYYNAAELLSHSGYSHYEISNYAHPGFESKHNLKYWRSENYIGVGLSAASYINAKRFVNTADMDLYISGQYLNPESLEIIDKKSELFEFIMLSLRLREGFSLKTFKSKFGTDFLDIAKDVIDKYKKNGLIINNDERISLSDSGFYISNSIISEILLCFDS